MVDELTQESFQTGKAIVTVSVDLITAIAEACKRSEEKNPGMSAEQKETLLGKVVDKVVSNYKETHGSLKDFNQEGKDVTSIDVNDERTAEILKKACKKSHIPVDMREVTRADGSVTHTAFCEVKSIDQVASLLKMASEQVLEEQKEMTKTLVLYDEHDQAIMSADFVNNGEHILTSPVCLRRLLFVHIKRTQSHISYMAITLFLLIALELERLGRWLRQQWRVSGLAYAERVCLLFQII